MRILYICPDTGIDVLGRKGASVHVREMIAAFDRAGHDVDLVAPRLVKPGAEAAHVPANVVRVRVPDAVQDAKQRLDDWVARFVPDTSLPKDLRRMLYDAALDRELAARYETDPPDLIYVRASLLSTAGVGLAARTGAPLVVELNAPLADEQERYRAGALADLYRSVEGSLLTAADLVTVVSAPLRAYALGQGVDEGKLRVIPNGVDQRRFKPSLPSPSERARIGLPAGPLLGFVGGLRPWHGVERLPAVLARVHHQHPDTKLVIVGDGPLRAEIERSAVDHGVSDRTVFLGALDHRDIPTAIAAFDVALAPYPDLPHDFYYSPLKLFEYLACGTPTVASAVGQIAELITSGEHALLTAPGDLDAIAAACSRLLADPVLASRLGRAGTELVHGRFTWDRNAAEVMAWCSLVG